MSKKYRQSVRIVCLSVFYQAAHELLTCLIFQFSVIYDDELTAAFFRTAHRIMSQAAHELLTCLIFQFSVIYDDELTAAFFRTAHRIMSQSPPKTMYIALERR